jgi:hypothetical protein
MLEGRPWVRAEGAGQPYSVQLWIFLPVNPVSEYSVYVHEIT